MSSPASVRFNADVADRLARFVAARPGLSAAAATNQLVDEALRCWEHPLIVFRDGAAGRRARLIGGPDVWEVVAAVRNAQLAEPDLDPADLIVLVGETSGVEPRLIDAALGYQAAFPAEIAAWLTRAESAMADARQRWLTEQETPGR